MRILSVDGGGYLGLASASFLKEAERHFKTPCAQRFDLFCGTSTGAIIALALASGKTASEIVELYMRMGAVVFPPIKGGALRRTLPELRHAKYDSRPLKEALVDTFGEATLGSISSRGKAVIVAAFSVTEGKPRVFKTDHSPRLTAHSKYKLVDVALASSAAPTYFPLAVVTNPTTGVAERFCDGGIFANAPALLGYAEALDMFELPASQIELLSISTPRMDLGERPGTTRGRRPDDRGKWVWKDSIFEIAVDSTSTVSVEALDRIMTAVGSRHERISLPNPDSIPFDLVTAETTASLLNIGVAHGNLTKVREQLHPFFSQ